MTYRIRIRVHEVEIEYEGSSAPDEPLVSELLSAVAQTHGDVKRSGPTVEVRGKTEATRESTSLPKSTTDVTTQQVGTVDNIMRKLGYGKSGSDLVVAAALHLTLVRGKNLFSRADLRSAARQSGNHKKGFPSNLSGYLRTAMNKNRLNEIEDGFYAVVPEYLEWAKNELS